MREVNPRTRLAPGRLAFAAVAGLFLSMSSCVENPVPPTHDERSAPSAAASKWLAIAEDERKSIEDRSNAVSHLEELKEEATAGRLVLLLPGDYDALTFRIVVALGEIKSRQALPTLKKMYHDKTVDVPGKIRAALKTAIRTCGGDPGDKR